MIKKNKFVKISLSLSVVFMFLIALSGVSKGFAAQKPPDIIVNGKKVSSEGAFIENGTTYVPIRIVSEALGAAVGWDGEANALTIDLG